MVSGTPGCGRPLCRPMTKIFLSYARGDDGEPFAPGSSFVARLYRDLRHAGFDVWFDRVCMPSRNLTFLQEIRDVIASCDRLVLIVGPHAVASDHVRQEWQFAYFQSEKIVTPIIRAGELTLIPDELKLLHCEDFRRDADYSMHLQQLVRILTDQPPPLGKLIAVPGLPDHLLARTDRLIAVRDALRADLDRPVVVGGSAMHVGLHGMGGIGKSVLASVLAHDRKIREAFPDGVVWIELGPEPDILARMREVHRYLGGEGLFLTEGEGQQKLTELLARKSVLLILDDVWRRPDIDRFDVLGARCRSLITTRDEGLLRSLGGVHHPVELLTDAEARWILGRTVGLDSAALPAAAFDVLRECGRLPLALALVGGLINAGLPWADVSTALQTHDLRFIDDRHAANAHHRDLWRVIQVSFLALAETAQERMRELAVFSSDEAIPALAIYTLWKHTGGLDPASSRKLLAELKDRSLVRLDIAVSGVLSTISLHDIVYDFCVQAAREVIQSDAALHEPLLAAYAELSPDGWPSGPDDSYFFTHLRQHLVAAGRGSELVKLACDLRWLEAKAGPTLFPDLVADLREAQRCASEPAGHREILGWLIPRLRAFSTQPDCLANEVANEFLPIIQHDGLRRCIESQLATRPARIRRVSPTDGTPAYLRYPHGYAEYGVDFLAVAADEPVAVAGDSSGRIAAWSLLDGQLLRFWNVEASTVGLVVNSDGTRVTVRTEEAVVLLRTDGSLQRAEALPWMERDTFRNIAATVVRADGTRTDLRARSDDEAMTSIASTPDGDSIVAVWAGRCIVAWDWSTGRMRGFTSVTEGDEVRAYAVAEGQVLIATAMGRGLCWTIGNRPDFEDVFSIPGGSISGVAASADGRISVWAGTSPSFAERLVHSWPDYRESEWFQPHDVVVVSPAGTVTIDEVFGPRTLWLSEAGEYLVASHHEFIDVYSVSKAVERGMGSMGRGSRSGGRVGAFKGDWSMAPDARRFLWCDRDGFLSAADPPFDERSHRPFPSPERVGVHARRLTLGRGGSHAVWCERDPDVLHMWTEGLNAVIECRVGRDFSMDRHISRNGAAVLSGLPLLRGGRMKLLRVSLVADPSLRADESSRFGSDWFKHLTISEGGSFITVTRDAASEECSQILALNRHLRELRLVGSIPVVLGEARICHASSVCIAETTDEAWAHWHQNVPGFPEGFARWRLSDLQEDPVFVELAESERGFYDYGVSRGGRVAFLGIKGDRARLITFYSASRSRATYETRWLKPRTAVSVDRVKLEMDSTGNYAVVGRHYWESVDHEHSLVWVVELATGRACAGAATGRPPTAGIAVTGNGSYVATCGEDEVAVWRTDFAAGSLSLHGVFFIDAPADLTFMSNEELAVVTAYGEVFTYEVRAR